MKKPSVLALCLAALMLCACTSNLPREGMIGSVPPGTSFSETAPSAEVGGGSGPSNPSSVPKEDPSEASTGPTQEGTAPSQEETEPTQDESGAAQNPTVAPEPTEAPLLTGLWAGDFTVRDLMEQWPASEESVRLMDGAGVPLDDRLEGITLLLDEKGNAIQSADAERLGKSLQGFMEGWAEYTATEEGFALMMKNLGCKDEAAFRKATGMGQEELVHWLRELAASCGNGTLLTLEVRGLVRAGFLPDCLQTDTAQRRFWVEGTYVQDGRNVTITGEGFRRVCAYGFSQDGKALFLDTELGGNPMTLRLVRT